MLTRILILLISCFICSNRAWSQPPNDDCTNATELCVGNILAGTTIGATIDTCFTTNLNGCADDNGGTGFCYEPSATVWYKFTTNSNGGSVTVDFTNLAIDPDPIMGKKLHAIMLRSENPCEGLNYEYVSPCQNNGIVDFSLTSINALLPNTTYYIQVDGSDAGSGVTESAQIDFDIMVSGPGVDVLPMSVAISAQNTMLCQFEQEPIDITLANCNGTPKFEWYYNGAAVGDSAVFLTGVLSESGDLYLKVICGTEGCPNSATSDSIFFDITPIQANAGPDILIEIGETAEIMGSGIGQPNWTPDLNLSSATSFSPLANPQETTIYFLTVTNGNCTLTDEMLVQIKRPINIPTGFTPNGDGNNDIWEVEFLEQYEDNQVIIYDRSGQVVYKTVGYNNGVTAWDGTYKDKEVPASTYFYFIDLRNGSENSVFRGPVTVIR